MRRNPVLILFASLVVAATAFYGEEHHHGYEEPHHGYGEEPHHGYGEEPHHGYGEEPHHGYGEEHHHGYGEEPHHGYDDHHHGYEKPVKCEEGFYGQCKKDPWGSCINPDIVGVWELTEASSKHGGYGHEQSGYGHEHNNQRWIMQFDEYDFCKQSGNYRITNTNGLTESVGYGTYVWVDKKYFILRDYSYSYAYKYPHSIVSTTVWKQDFKLIGYDKGKSVKPAVGITRDLYGKIINKEVAENLYRRLKGPAEGIEH